MPTTELDTEGVAGAAPSLSEGTPLHIFASVRIHAETRRVLYALALPEYMEAWLQLPEMERVECHPDLRSFDRFRIDLFACDRCRGCIYGSCLLSKPDKVTYLWQRDREGGGATTVVEIRLWGGRSRCTLNLQHGGFLGRAEAEWYRSMWQSSLGKLRKLMEGVPAIELSYESQTS